MKHILEKWFDEVWTKENASFIKEMFVPETNGSAKGLGNENGIGPDEFEAFHTHLLGLIKNIEITIDSHIESENVISSQCTLTATDRKTGAKKISIQGCVIVKIVSDKIVDADNYFDFLSMFESLGLLPKNTFLNCLSGRSLN